MDLAYNRPQSARSPAFQATLVSRELPAFRNVAEEFWHCTVLQSASAKEARSAHDETDATLGSLALTNSLKAP